MELLQNKIYGPLVWYQETRRRQQSEAAERRAAQEAARGVKDPSKIERMQKRSEEMEKREQELSRQGGPGLKVSIKGFYLWRLSCHIIRNHIFYIHN